MCSVKHKPLKCIKVLLSDTSLKQQAKSIIDFLRYLSEHVKIKDIEERLEDYHSRNNCYGAKGCFLTDLILVFVELCCDKKKKIKIRKLAKKSKKSQKCLPSLAKKLANI